MPMYHDANDQVYWSHRVRLELTPPTLKGGDALVQIRPRLVAADKWQRLQDISKMAVVIALVIIALASVAAVLGWWGTAVVTALAAFTVLIIGNWLTLRRIPRPVPVDQPWPIGIRLMQQQPGGPLMLEMLIKLAGGLAMIGAAGSLLANALQTWPGAVAHYGLVAFGMLIIAELVWSSLRLVLLLRTT